MQRSIFRRLIAIKLFKIVTHIQHPRLGMLNMYRLSFIWTLLDGTANTRSSTGGFKAILIPIYGGKRMNNIDDSEMKNPLLPNESLLSEKFSRRTFMKGFAATTAAVSLSTILPATILADKGEEAEAVAADVYASGNGIYLDGGNVNMNGKSYTLEFTQPVQLKAVVGGKVQTEGVWRSNYKHLVSVDPNGTVRMRDGVGGYDVDVTWTKDGINYKVTFHTGQTAGGYSIDVDAPMTRGEFMIRLANYFGWCHYNNVMDDGSDINDDGSWNYDINAIPKPGRYSPTRAGTPCLNIPAFSPAISSRVPPSNAQWSRAMLVMTERSGMMMFVLSRRPPRPVSITATSTFSSENHLKAKPVVISKKDKSSSSISFSYRQRKS